VRAYVQGAGHKSVESLALEAMSAQRMLGAKANGAKIAQIPSVSRTADPEAWKAFDAAAGVPADGKYAAYKPETGHLLLNDTQLATLDKNLHAVGATPDQRTAVLNSYHQMAAADEAANEAAWTQECSQGNLKLKSDWGDKFDGNIKIADRALEDQLGDDFMKLLKDSRIADHPIIREAGYKLAQKFAESPLTPAGDNPGGALTKEAAQKELDTLEASDAFKAGEQKASERRAQLLGIIHG